MKVIMSLIALMALFVVEDASAREGGRQQQYRGTAAGRGGFISKTGFVKARTNEENNMDGKMEEEQKHEAGEEEDADLPPPSDEKDDSSSEDREGQ